MPTILAAVGLSLRERVNVLRHVVTASERERYACQSSGMECRRSSSHSDHINDPHHPQVFMVKNVAVIHRPADIVAELQANTN